MKIAISGLAGSGKTTLFNILTGSHQATGDFSPSAHIAHITVPDERLAYLAGLYHPHKVTPVAIDFMDLPGLVVAGNAGSEQNRQILGQTRESDALIFVLRDFINQEYPNPRGKNDVLRDFDTLMSEIMLSDFVIAENRVQKLKKSVTRPSATQEKDKKELEILEKCIELFEEEKPLTDMSITDEQEKLIRSYQFLCMKPRIFVINLSEHSRAAFESYRTDKRFADETVIPVCADLEMEIAELDPDDRQEFLADLGLKEPTSAKIIQAAFETTGLISFFTVGEDEVRAWPVSKNADAITAAGKVHTDMARGFIRAQVVSFSDLKACGSMKETKAQGKVRLEGKDSLVKDGDIIEFRFSV